MKDSFLVPTCCLAAALIAPLRTLADQTSSPPGNAGVAVQLPPPTPYQVVESGGNYNVWQRYTYKTAPDGTIVAKTHRYTELASGLNYWNNGQWAASKEEIDVLPQGGAAATQGQQQVYFPGDIYQGAIELTTPDGQQLQNRPMGISYDDGTNTVLIAALTNSIGQLVSPNQVVYPNAFTGFNADLVCTYRKGGFECDLVFREQPPVPETYGLSSENVRLQLLTEFFNPPEPVQTTSAANPLNGLTDTTLKFGSTTFGHGKAFIFGDQTQQPGNNPAVRVYKSWLHLNGRTFLIEQVPYPKVSPDLQTLPPAGTASSSSANSILNKVSTARLLVPSHSPQACTNVMQLAKADWNRNRGVVLDYTTLNSDQTDFTFQGDTTYYISSGFSISDTATFEGGTVIKYAPGASIGVNNVNCLTGPYRPAVFTAMDDDSVGEQVSGSSGSPSGYYGNPAISSSSYSGIGLAHMRFSYAQTAFYDVGNDVDYGNNLRDVQILDCGTGVFSDGEAYTSLGVFNGLINRVNCAFDGVCWNGFSSIQQVTVNNCKVLVNDDSCGAYVSFQNSIFANVTNITVDGVSYVYGNTNGFYKSAPFGSAQYTNTFYPFQTAGGGSYYLTNGVAFRNAGTTSIDPTLLAELKTKTTWPPVSFVSWNNLTLGPQVPRDTNAAPDLGYHYDPIDYVINANLDGALRFLPGTVVSGGVALDSFGASVNFNGSAVSPCWYVTADTVQEAGGFAGAGVGTTANGVDCGGASATFTKFSTLADEGTVYFSDLNADYPAYSAVNSEFYGGDIGAQDEGSYYVLTDCLFWRTIVGDDDGDDWIVRNCLFWNGELFLQSWSLWTIENCAFDGAAITNDGTVSASSLWPFDYNAFLTNDDLVVYGGSTHDVTNVINFNWQSSWFGNYYLPTNSPLINTGNTNANLLGLYHFTTQTNQVPETNSIVDIGYHYVATDHYGNPLDSNGDGIPDYLEDANGDGVWDNGETNWGIAILVQPVSQTVVQGTNVTFSVTAGGISPLSYQWYFNGTNRLSGATNSSLTLTIIQLLQAGNYSVVVTNSFGALTSSNATLTVYIHNMVVGFGDDSVGQCDVPFGLTNAVQVAGAGVTGAGAHSLALKNDGMVIAWGENLYGEGSVPTNLFGVAMITAGWYHNVALLTNGTVTAWGLNLPSIGYPLTQVPSNLTNATVISAQALHTLALESNGTVLAWGYNSSFGETNVPVGLTNVTAISAGYQFNLVVSNGTVVAWGDNRAGQCNVPAGLSNVVDVAAGIYHSLALLQNGTVVAWGDDLDGETDVPAGLSNVVAIAAGGDPDYPGFYTAYSLALKSDGTVVAWGDDETVDPVGGLSNVIGIASGADHALAVRTGPATPVITLEPTDAYQVQGGNATFTARGAGLYGVTYLWQFNGVNISGATNAALTVTNVQTAQLGTYDVVVTDNAGMGSIVSSNANLAFVTPPVILSQSPLPTNQIVLYLTNVTLNVMATAPGTNNGFSLSYQWQFNGSNIAGANGASYNIHANANSTGTYSVQISNAAGSTNAAWQVTVYYPGLLITQQPTNQYQIAGGAVSFIGDGIGSNTLTYQWAFNGTNIAGATNALLMLTNVQAAQQGYYNFTASILGNSLTSSNAWFYLVTTPVLISQTVLTNQNVILQSGVNLGVVASAPGQTNGFPLHYQWQFNGSNISGANLSNYTFSAVNSGTYSVIVTNAAGGTNASWLVNVIYPGGAAGWGDDSYGQYDPPPGLTNISALATGEYHAVAVRDNGSVVQWGYDWGDVPANLTNAVSVAAGYEHSITLRADGTVATWGYSNCPGIFVPSNLPPVKAVAAGWLHSVVLLTNGTVMAWGDNYFGQTNVPADLTNVISISTCSYHNLALKADGTVEGWGYNFDGITTAPAGLSNVVAIYAGFQDSLALKSDGTIVVWGDNSYGQTNVPAGLSNIMAVAAGWYHCVALKNDGTVVTWGDDTYGQTNVPGTLANVKLLAAAHDYTMAGIFSPYVQYPVDVTKDVLLIFNTNSTNSIAVKDYYLANRPMIAGANVLGVACQTGEFFTNSTDCDTQLVVPVLNWLTNHPTKRPEYVVLFYDIPMRLWTPGACGSAGYGDYGSMSYRLYNAYLGWKPFVNNINQGSVADCEAYVDKLTYIGTNYSPGKLIISARAGGYGNTNYYFDAVGTHESTIARANSGVLSVNPSASIIFSNSIDDGTLDNHIRSGTHIAGYMSDGAWSSLGNQYAINPLYITWSGNSDWYIIETVESFNGERVSCGQGNFVEWFSSNAFGGTNYSNTPVGAVSHVEEPGLPGVNDCAIYFGLWESGKNFAICAWNSRKTPYFQAVGDPLITK